MPAMAADKGQIARSLAVSNMAAFVAYTCQGYKMGWVHAEICRELDVFLQKVIEKKSPRLIVAMPPRHGKSELASRRFPAYVFGRHPDMSIIATSHTADLAASMNRDVQRIIDGDEYKSLFPGTTLFGKNVRTIADGLFLRNSDIFEIVNRKGVYKSAGIGGGITGRGGDILIVDDPFKDRAEADSPTIREKIWGWYTSTFYTRRSPGAGVIVIATRWHLDDLTGRLIEAARQGIDKWRIVNFPAIATTDEKHRKAGEALHPERYSLAELLRDKAVYGTRDWEALYQQNPVPDGGAIFKKEWLKYYDPTDLPKKFEQVVLSWDMTFKDGDDSDFVVGQVWGKQGGMFFLLDQARGQWSFTETVEQFIKLSRKWPQALRKLVEDKANGPAVIDTLKKSIPGLTPIQPDGSKTARAYAVTPLFEAGNVYIPNSAWCKWSKVFEAEITSFPSAAHDDQVDAMTQALRSLTRRPALNINPLLLTKH